MTTALPLLQRALYYDPNSSEIHYMLAMAQLTLGNPKQALGNLKSVKETPQKNNLYLLTAIALNSSKEMYLALEAVNRHIA